jgi:hypothetical protein
VLLDVVEKFVEPRTAEDADVGGRHAVLASDELELDSFFEPVSFLESDFVSEPESDFELESLADSVDLVDDELFDRLSVL